MEKMKIWLTRGERDVMTPEPRAFVLDSSVGQDAINEALGLAYTVATDQGTGSRRRAWLDTFDWRLYEAGLVLEHEQTRSGGRLILTGSDGATLAEQPVTARQSTRVLDLPDGPVADRIGSLISPRALLPVARGVSTRSVFRLLNTDGKTVARVLVDRTTTAGTELSPRLQIAEVRGYTAQARRAAGLLAVVASPAAEPVFITAATANGRAPGGYTGKVDAAITAAMPARTAVATLLSSLLDTLEQNVDGVLRDIDTEFLHDLRVAVRRTRSALKLLGDVLPDDLTEHYKTEFKWLGDLTTPVRDLDVHLLGFGGLAAGLLAAAPEDLEPFREFLVRRRAREFRRLTAGLRSERFRALTHDWRKALAEFTEPGTSRGRAGSPADSSARTQGRSQAKTSARSQAKASAGSLASERTLRAVRKLVRQGAAITAHSPAESLHDLRKRGKELRYLLEFFAPFYDRATYRMVLSDMKKLQDCLGEFQDSQVQREELTTLARQLLEAAGPGHAALAATLLAMGEINARLAVNQQRARADFGRQFIRFAGPATQRHIQALLTQGDL
jgi:CHAD domain-containing protein